ncbi:Nif3-like dinuclear metal center hexameric protein [Rarobacter faecitabidus]|uniref:GTP cyclohydrolase 1 type 2 homolog n=1 Tax=Rarobacter faecitabidus TaxID=13243 RepID=A0A542ZV63_RARFA|nr:Nif3-like dinuclear metal center hexameric protein [Rarobacter faecitabidus]TQL64255.1 dinuclear metal center YbgI/SA1388 family protein [Rarobacter faecitabidus]
MRLSDVIARLDEWFPRALAEPWDSVGLIVGDPDRPVRRILLALDPVRSVVDEASDWSADLIITHHPLFLKPVHQLSTETFKGAIVHRLIAAQCALFNAHTNADRAADGVAHALTKRLGLIDSTPLAAAQQPPRDKYVVFSPLDATDGIQAAMSAAGAGRIGEYSSCAWRTEGEGTFTASKDANPTIGEPGQKTTVREHRLEMVAPRSARAAVTTALRAAHPYEEPAYEVTELASEPSDLGLGRMGRLPSPMSLREFAEHAARVLPATAQGIRVAGDLDAVVERVAVVGGSGDSMIGAARAAGADVYLTSDLRHHPVSEAREEAMLGDGRPFLVDTAHFASESVWLDDLAQKLTAIPSARLEVRIARESTDPWTAHFPSVTTG